MPRGQSRTQMLCLICQVSPDNWDLHPLTPSVFWVYNTEMTHGNGKREASGDVLAKIVPHHNAGITHAGSFLIYRIAMQHGRAYRESKGSFAFFSNLGIR